MRDRAEWLGIRLDAGQILASALEPFLAGEGFFRLAIADSEDLPIVPAPRAPEDYAPPALASHGMMLRAYPTDMDGYLESARSSKASAALLLGFLFLAASIGAVWMWRSVSRETELLALKVDLVSRVSHELKTPLSLISLYGETLAMKRARDQDQAARPAASRR
jgi:signal transduction histidine kinase